MAIDRRSTPHGTPALAALRAAVAELQQGDRLRPVTVVVPSNSVGVAARRWLARNGGVAAVQFLTLYRLAELLGGPALASSGRRPVSSPVVDIALRRAVRSDGGVLRNVGHHRATIEALRTTYAELRQLDDDQLDILRQQASRRGRDVVRIADATRRDLREQWYDERDLLDAACSADGAPARVVVHLPERLRPAQRRLVDHLAATGTVIVVEADDPSGTSHPVPPVEVVEVTDADEEAREAVRQVLAAAHRGVPLEAMAIVWPTRSPYARVVTDQLTAATIAWNGQGGTELVERLAPRVALGWLRLDRRGLRRVDLFALLAQVPARSADGAPVPNQRYERISRMAGVHGAGDWHDKLSRFAARADERRPDTRDAADARALMAFVDELTAELGEPSTRRPPSAWATATDRIVRRWLSSASTLHADEVQAIEHLERVTLRLHALDPIAGPLTRADFADLLEAELEAVPARVGRIGSGIQVGPLSFTVGQPLELLVVLGAADGTLPAPPPQSGLLPDRDRQLVGDDLPRAGDWPLDQRRHFVASLAGAQRAVLCVPLGDLRATTQRPRSRFITELAARTDISITRRPSYSHTLATTDLPATPGGFRARALVAAASTGADLHQHPLVQAHPPLSLGLRLLDARRSDLFTEYDGLLPDIGATTTMFSPSALERWSSCPWHYFVRYVLGVQPIEDPDRADSITAADKGTLVHEALNDLHQAVLHHELPQPAAGWTAEHVAALEAAYRRHADEAEARGLTGRRAMWHHDQRRLWRQLRSWLDHDSQVIVARAGRVEASEIDLPNDGSVGVDLSSQRRVSIHGRIDRIDLTPDGIVVTDLKTGGLRTMKADDPTNGGRHLQLLLYALAAPSLLGVGDDTPVQVEYAFINLQKRPSLPVDDAVRAELHRQLERIVGAIDAGVFIARPPAPSTFHGWIECPMCDPDGMGTASGHRRYLRKSSDPQVAGIFGEPTDDEGEAA